MFHRSHSEFGWLDKNLIKFSFSSDVIIIGTRRNTHTYFNIYESMHVQYMYLYIEQPLERRFAEDNIPFWSQSYAKTISFHSGIDIWAS